jgi:chemotaxis protein MotB
LVELASELQKIADGRTGVSVRLAEDGVRLDFESAALFDTGIATLKPGSLVPLEPLLNKLKATTYSIDVEGHTDDVPLFKQNGEDMETNWSLSGRRASSVIHYLIGMGFVEDKLRIVGYAANKPKSAIGKKDGAALERARSDNRRVSILVR